MHRETNPYFLPPHEPQFSSQFPPSNAKDQTPQQHSPDSYFPGQTMPVSPRHPQPQLHSGPQPHHGHDSHLPTPRHQQPHSGSRPHNRHSSGDSK